MKTAFHAIQCLWKYLLISLGVHLLVMLALLQDQRANLAWHASVLLQVVASSSGQQPEAQPASRPEQFPRPVPLRKSSKSTSEKSLAALPSKVSPAQPEKGEAVRHTNPGETTGESGIKHAAPAAPPPAQEAISADALRQYLLALSPEVRRFKRYPVLARERGWEGEVEITIGLGRMQGPPAIAIRRSSGYPILDEQAKTMLAQAVRLVAVPEPLRGKEIEVAVPVRFSLDD